MPYTGWEIRMPKNQLANVRRGGMKQERLEARVTPEQKRMIERAAEIRGTTVTNFVILSAQKAATETIREFDVLSLRDKAREVFVRALLNPPPPNAKARAASRRYRRRMGL
jgi:uncharacterized protein (DUF1778 family)